MRSGCNVESSSGCGGENISADASSVRAYRIKELTSALQNRYNGGHPWKEAAEVMANAERNMWSWRTILEFWMDGLETCDEDVDIDVFADLTDLFVDVLGDDVLSSSK